jgi:hypothetical protein
MAQEQIASWTHLTDAVGRTFRVQLDTVSTDASKPVWFHPRELRGD